MELSKISSTSHKKSTFRPPQMLNIVYNFIKIPLFSEINSTFAPENQNFNIKVKLIN